jgi:tRNA(fMet)-specific endonuclease VapC
VAERLILDTTVLIAMERGRVDLATVTSDDSDAVLPAIVVTEFLVGVRLAATDRQRDARQATLDRARRSLPVQNYTERVAEHHAALLAHVHRSGKPRGAHDLIIAATARATGRTVLTTDDRARFDELPEVDARPVPLKTAGLALRPPAGAGAPLGIFVRRRRPSALRRRSCRRHITPSAPQHGLAGGVPLDIRVVQVGRENRA